MHPQVDKNMPVWLLACGQTLGYACLFYLFAAVVVEMEAATGWEKTTLALGPTLAILISAGLAPISGRLVDRGFGLELMTFGAVIGAAGLVALALGTSLALFLVAWAIIGVAHGTCLYEVCFAYLVRRFGIAARPAIIRVTLVAGFASTLAFPAGAALAVAFGWKGAVWVAAAVMLFAVAPLHFFGTRSLRRSTRPPAPGEPSAVAPGRLREVMRSAAFWMLALIFALISLTHWMLITFLVPVLIEQGATRATAVLVASLVGPAQVVGRLLLMRYEARIGTGRAMWMTMAAMVAASAMLLLAGAAPWLAFGFALCQGAANGIVTILRPMLIAETLGQGSFGAIAGFISTPTLLTTALAPVLGAYLFGFGGATLLLGAALGLAAAALWITLIIERRNRAPSG